MSVRKNLTSSTEDLAAGQVVIVTARWILIGAGLVFALWDPGKLSELRVQLLVLFLLGLVNFYLQSQAMTRRATLSEIVYAASAADIVVVSLLVYAGDGLSSQLFVFYFPALLALSVAFVTELTVFYTVAAAGLYAITCLAFLGDEGTTSDNLQTLFTRVLMFVAVATCGNLYWRIETRRRGETAAMPSTADAAIDDLSPAIPATPHGQEQPA